MMRGKLLGLAKNRKTFSNGHWYPLLELNAVDHSKGVLPDPRTGLPERKVGVLWLPESISTRAVTLALMRKAKK
jgi:hypothetical protein